MTAPEQGRNAVPQGPATFPRRRFAQALDRWVRRWVPSTVLFTRSWLFNAASWPPDRFAPAVLGIITRQPLPPLPLVVRTGVGYSILFPQ